MYDFHKQRLEGHRWDVFSVAFSPDGEILSSGYNDGGIVLWDLKR